MTTTVTVTLTANCFLSSFQLLTIQHFQQVLQRKWTWSLSQLRSQSQSQSRSLLLRHTSKDSHLMVLCFLHIISLFEGFVTNAWHVPAQLFNFLSIGPLVVCYEHAFLLPIMYIQTSKVPCLWVGCAENKAKQFPRLLTFAFYVKFLQNALLWTGRSDRNLFARPTQTQSTLASCCFPSPLPE